MEDVQQFITYAIHEYMRSLLGDIIFMALSTIFILIGLILLAGSVSNSNMLLGDPKNRDRSTLDDIQYVKVRLQLRIVLGVIGAILIVYNILGLSV